MIKQFIQGQETDGELYCLMGQWALSQAVHEQLGIAVTGEAGDVWLVKANKDGEPAGFAQLRVLKNNKGHLRYLFSESYPVKLELGNAVIKLAKATGLESIYTNERRDSPVMPHFDFKKITDNGKTKFCRWERSLA